ncbi:MAG: hypothetical protein HY047_15030 [Acidobacteria bacterium]|nr:hypothetical protein [Acidobacteriota bacterium]
MHPHRFFTRLALVLTGIVFMLPSVGAQLAHTTFAPGDLFVSLEQGPVQWRNADGTLNAVLVSSVPGKGEGMRLDTAANLYVSHWCADPTCRSGNTVERFNSHGVSQGTFGAGYSCNPHALVFDAAGSAYVGQADCTGAVLKLSASGQPLASYAVAQETRGSFWVDLASDGCTLLYTSWGPDVMRFNVCTNSQLANFNRAPLPGGQTQALVVLPDGGVLVSSGGVIARLNASGSLTQTYSVSGESQYWAGLDLVGDGTFWAINYFSSNVYRFNLSSGALVASFSTGAGSENAVDIRVYRPAPGGLGLPIVLPFL